MRTRYIINFINNEHSINHCYNLYHNLTDIENIDIEETIKYVLNYTNDLQKIKTFIDILVCAKENIAITTINRLVFNNKNVSFIKEEVANIRQDMLFIDYNIINSNEYYIYYALFNGKNFNFNYLILTDNKFFENKFIRDNIQGIVNFLYYKEENLYPLFKKLCEIKDLHYKNVVYDILDYKSYNKRHIYERLLPNIYKSLAPLESIFSRKNYGNINKIKNLLIERFKDMDRLTLIKEVEEIIHNYKYFVINFFDEILNKFIGKSILNDYLHNYGTSLFYGFDNYYKFNLDEVKNENIFEGYFTFNYDLKIIEDEEKDVLITIYNLVDLNDKTLISLYKREDVYYFDENSLDDIHNRKCDFKYAKTLIKLIENNEEFKKEKEEKEKEVIKLNLEKDKNKLLALFNELEQNILQKEAISYDYKVHLEYYIYDYNDHSTLELKIGNNKKSYIVKDLNKFVDFFIYNETYKYGKDLIFVHNIDNVVDEDKKIIELLLQTDKSDFDGRRLHLTRIFFTNFLKNLDNRIIYLNNVEYKVINDPISVNINLDSSYHLKIDYFDGYFLELNNVIYFKNNVEKKLQKVNDNQIPLIKLISNIGNKSLIKVKEEFKNRIYPIFKDFINVDEEIKDEFKTSNLMISSYIDFIDNEIKLNYKFIKDKEIDKLDNVYDESIFNRYKIILNKMGFDDDLKIKEEDIILNFFKLDLTPLKKFGDVYLSEVLDNKKIQTFTPPTIKMNYNNGMMKVFMNESNYSEEELQDILLALKNKRKFVLLKNKSIIKLDENSKDFYNIVDDLEINKKDLFKEVSVPLYKTLGIDSKNIIKDEYLNKMVDDIKNFKNKDIKLPSINASLRDYQRYGYNWLKILTSYNLGGILADDMGLGKTIMTITTLLSDENNSPSLIVSPTSLVFNWMNEFNKFSDCKVKFIYGNQKDRENMILNIKEDEKVIYLTSYDSLRNDIELYDKEFNFVFLDEAQYIKNVYALKTINVKKIKAKHRFCLTGTPIENDIFDLWSLFDFLMPSYLPSLNKFKKYGNDPYFIDSIKRKVTPFILRRTKSEVLNDLPPKSEKIISCSLTKEQRKLYDATCLNAKNLINSKASNFDVLPLLMRLRQICVDPRTYLPSFDGESSKMNLLFDIIDDYIKQNRKMLIFSQFVTALELIEKYLKSKNIKYCIITGKTESKKRIEYVNMFNNDKEYHVFLVSLKAGGHGLNLTGADTVIHLDPWWNVSVENQATDRAHRIGQVNNVEVIKLIVENSVEQRVIELQNKKKELIESLINEDSSLIEKMTIEDLKYILE